MSLSNLWCKRHPQREAVVNCPACEQFFCRECVVEHEERYLCQTCIEKNSTLPLSPRHWTRGLLLIVGYLLGALLMTGVFYGGGKLLLSIPSRYHQGNFW